MFAVMNYLTPWRLFLTVYDKKKTRMLFPQKGGKQAPISPAHTGRDERNQRGNQLENSFSSGHNFLHTLTALNLNYHQHTFAQTN